MPNLAKLRQEHATILRIAERLRSTIGQERPPPPLDLLALRHELSVALIGHLKSEDWVLYPYLQTNADSRTASIARTLSDQMGGLADSYAEHCRQWDAAAIASDWAGYRSACRTLLNALTKRISRENRELYPLLEALSRAA